MDFSCKGVLGIVLCTAVFCISSGQQLVTNCSSNGYTYGAPGDVLCQLDRAYLTTSCGLPPGQVQFAFYSPAGVRSIYCVASFSSFPSAGTPDATCPSCSCSSDATGSEYTLTFTPDSTVHYNGRFECDVDCLSGAPTEDHSSCNPIPFPTPPTTQESTSTATPAPPTAPPGTSPCPDTPCPDGERWLCPPWEIGPIVFGLFRLFAILYFLYYVFCPAEYILWPFNRRLAWWEIFCMSVATVLFPECVVLDIIDAIRWRPCCCHSCNCSWRRILLLVLAILICLVSVIYMIIAATVQLWPFPEITIDGCGRKDCECQCEGWQIFLFVVSCIGIALLVCFLIAFLCKRPRNRWFYKLLVKCGKCHKWHLFSVTLDDNKLQNIFIQKNLNEIFKKCANHGQEEFDLQEVEQKLEEILPQYQNVTLDQTICLKDHSRDKWYKQDHDPGQAVLDAVMKGKWSWSKGFGTEVDQTGMTEVLQIRLYLLSKSAFREHGGAIEMRRVDGVSSGAQ